MTDFLTLQVNLKVAGRDPGALDGQLGPKTLGALVSYAALRTVDPAFGAAMAVQFPLSQITTPLRIAHFLAQAEHETGEFRWLTEMGPPTYFKRYDGRADLGNTQPGDGALFRGRGIFQLTGRANYVAYGRKLGLDLVDMPEMAAQPDTAVKIACRFWPDHGLNLLADGDDIEAITRKINGGLNGLADRQAHLDRIKHIWGIAS